jgi:hypothetical protein
MPVVIDKILNWTAQKTDADFVLLTRGGDWTYTVREGANRMKLAEKLREVAREVENG